MLAAFLTATPDPEHLTSVRRVFFSGEALPAATAAAADHLFAGADLHNLYGPTEAAVDVTAAPVHASALTDVVTVPIGTPVANTVVRVLDSWLRPVPVGVTGELYLGGVQLADGYIGRTDLTASRFVATGAGQRLYRTGDLVRWNHAGELDYLGRSDDQVKIRGFRIELDEIRVVLQQHPAVSTAVVIAADHPGGNDKYLAAYYVGTEITDGELREYLTARVPDYMIPTVFISIDTVPVTPNGKLDRRALPTPDLTAALTGGQHPTTVTETTLATVFADILHLPTDTELSIDDDFFRLGGDSISSIQVVTAARRAGITITAADVFTHRTISALARIGDTHTQTQTHTETEPTTVTTAPLQPIAARYIDRPGFDHFTQSFVFTTPPDLTTDTLHRILNRIATAHPTLGARLRRTETWEFTLPSTTVESPIQSLTTSDGWSSPQWLTTVDDLVTRMSDQMDPTNGVLWRAMWCTTSSDATGRLVMVIHHLAVDGVSWRILQDDLAHAWALETGATEDDLLPAGTSITTWTHALTERARDPHLTDQLEHWNTVADATHPLFGERSVDPERDTHATTGQIEVTVPADLTATLIGDITTALSASVEDILLAALAIATGGWRARHGLEPQPVTIGMEGHGRQETLVPGADLSRSIGWFTTWYPILADLTDLDPIDTLTDPHLAADAVLRIKDTLARVPDRGISYGILTHLNTEAALPQNIPDIGFNYLGNLTSGTAGDRSWTSAPEIPGIRGHVPAELPAAAVVDANIAAVSDADGATVFDGSFAYAEKILTTEQAHELVQLWTATLRCLAAYTGRSRRSLTDFTATGLTYNDVTAWEERYGDLTDVQPLTPLQHGMVFESMLGAVSGTDVYLTHTAVTVTGLLDLDRLRIALDRLTDTHPNLKAAITPAANGEYVAVIPTDATVTLSHTDIDTYDTDAIAAIIDADRTIPLALDEAPLMRVTAVTTAADQHTLILTIHHAITDGWSTPPLIATLLRAYNNPTTPALPDTTYPSFLHWLTHHDHTTSLDTWTTALADVTEPTLITTTTNTATTNTATTDTATTDTAQPIELTHTIDPTLTHQLRTLARTHSTTLNT
ncbi:condensation domain-containing protein, partial [Rhodococcoides fascians]|uniref:condensation domain-containing protein n=1 Tax=Rhodococcoides fascians TaxID=1828 RepID=UPI001F4D0675